MEEYISLLFKTFNSYIEAIVNSEYWWFPILPLLFIWIVSFLITKFIKVDKSLTREFKILSIIIKVSIFTELILIAIFSYCWIKTDIYITHNEKLSHIISLVIPITVQVIAFIILSKMFTEENILRIINCPSTKGEDVNRVKIAKSNFKKLKIWTLIPALGFLLLLIPTNKKSLVSFLLDNSSSMDEQLSNAEEIFKATFYNLEDDTDIVLSWFSENNPKKNLSDIIRIKDYTQLVGVHTLFTDKKTAISSVSDIEKTGGTPLVETIWSNYLFNKEIAANKEYSQKIFVLVTDGVVGYISDDKMTDFLCEIDEFNEFYESNINIVNLAGNENPFFNKAIECNYQIYEGMDIDSYSSSISHILKGVSKDKYFPTWIAIFFALGVIIILIINPKKR